MFESGGKSVRCQNLHEPLLSPCISGPAVKSPLGAQTVLGDRHDLIYEILMQVPSAACGTRPRELSNGWRRKQIRNGSEKRSSENLIRQRGRHPMTTRHTRVDFRRSCGSAQNCSVEPLKWATSVVFRHWLPISSRRACESHAAACGTRPAEFFNGWARKRKRERVRATLGAL